jgi:hypothetical protein
MFQARRPAGRLFYLVLAAVVADGAFGLRRVRKVPRGKPRSQLFPQGRSHGRRDPQRARLRPPPRAVGG